MAYSDAASSTACRDVLRADAYSPLAQHGWLAHPRMRRANFFENPSKGFGAVRPRKMAFPIDFVHGPNNMLDAILNFENAKIGKSVHPTDS